MTTQNNSRKFKTTRELFKIILDKLRDLRGLRQFEISQEELETRATVPVLTSGKEEKR